MKKFCVSLAMLALALVLGLAFVGCSNDTTNDTANEGPGVLTVTDIPSQYNGKYALFRYTNDFDKTPIWGMASDSTLTQIQNGRVDIPLHIEGGWSVYDGTETLPASGYFLFFYIFDDATLSSYDARLLLRRFPSISFVNGRGTVSFNTAY